MTKLDDFILNARMTVSAAAEVLIADPLNLSAQQAYFTADGGFTGLISMARKQGVESPYLDREALDSLRGSIEELVRLHTKNWDAA